MELKLPLRSVAIGLLLGIVLTFVLEPATVEGTALLILLTVLFTAVAGWIIGLVHSKTNRPKEEK